VIRKVVTELQEEVVQKSGGNQVDRKSGRNRGEKRFTPGGGPPLQGGGALSPVLNSLWKSRGRTSSMSWWQLREASKESV